MRKKEHRHIDKTERKHTTFLCLDLACFDVKFWKILIACVNSLTVCLMKSEPSRSNHLPNTIHKQCSSFLWKQSNTNKKLSDFFSFYLVEYLLSSPRLNKMELLDLCEKCRQSSFFSKNSAEGSWGGHVSVNTSGFEEIDVSPISSSSCIYDR